MCMNFNDNPVSVLAYIVRDMVFKSPTMKSELEASIGGEQLSLYMNSLKDILTTDTKQEKAEKSAKVYKYDGCEAVDYFDKAKTDEDLAANNAKRREMFGEVIMLTAFKDDKCVLEIYYDWTLEDVLQPVIESGTGRLLGFCKSYYDKLCGKARLRNNLQKFAEEGQKAWEYKHKFETDCSYLQANPKYSFKNTDLLAKLQKRYYAIHPLSEVKAEEVKTEVKAEEVKTEVKAEEVKTEVKAEEVKGIVWETTLK